MEDSLLLAHDGERENVNEKLSSNILVVVAVVVLFEVEVRRRSKEDALGRGEQSVVVGAISTWGECRF